MTAVPLPKIPHSNFNFFSREVGEGRGRSESRRSGRVWVSVLVSVPFDSFKVSFTLCANIQWWRGVHPTQSKVARPIVLMPICYWEGLKEGERGEGCGG
jgi:hypothetical protein